MKEKTDGAVPRRLRSGRFVAVVVALSLMTAGASVALVEANADAARSVAEDSTSLNWANATLGSVALSRAALHQALFFRVEQIVGDASFEDAEIALEEAAGALSIARDWVARGPDDQRLARGEAEAAVATGDDVLALVAEGDVEAAAALLEGDFESQYRGAGGLLRAVQEAGAAKIAAAQSESADIERIAGLFVSLLIPAAAIIISQLILRRRNRDERLTMQATLDAAQELSRAKDTFIASFSHELRTPLTGIYGFADYVVESRLHDPDEAMEMIKMIRQDASELSRMVEDILVAGRLESGDLVFEESAVDLTHLAQRERAIRSDDGHTISVHAVPTFARATEKHVAQIVRNLVSNAVRYGGGQVDIVVSQLGDMATIAVSDRGPGVPEDVRERMFTRFVNEGEQTLLKGSVGLGLAVSNALAFSMGGAITYERKLGWTNFILSLPAAEPSSPAAQVSESPYRELVSSHFTESEATLEHTHTVTLNPPA